MKENVQTQLFLRRPSVRSVVVIVSLLVVLGITTLPTVFYVWNPSPNVYELERKPQNQSDVGSCNNGEGVSANSLIASACSVYLNWSLASLTSLNNTRNISLLKCDFEETEKELKNILLSLSYFPDTLECQRHATPLICHYLYHDCTVPAPPPTSQDCLRIQNNICREQWDLAANILRSGALGSCVAIPDCDRDFSNSTTHLLYGTENAFSGVSLEKKKGHDNKSEVSCKPPLVRTELRDVQFPVDCSPACLEENWTRRSEQLSLEVMLYLTGVFSLFCVVVTFITWAKVAELRQFPQSTLLFVVIAYVVAVVGFALPLLVGRRRAYCNHKDVLSTWEDPSVICRMQGVLVHFGISSALVWWLCSIFNVFVSVYVVSPVNPIRRYSRTIFMFEMLLSVALPAGLVGVVLGVGGRYSTYSVQVVSCGPPSVKLMYFTMALPIQLVVIVGVVMTSLIVLKLRKVTNNRSFKCSTSTASATQTTIQTRFLMIIIFFPLCFGTIMSSIVVYDKLSDNIVSTYIRYVSCLQSESDPAVCAEIQHNYGSVITCIIDLVMFDVFSVVMVAYVLAPALARQFWMRHLRNIRQRAVALFTKDTEQTGETAAREIMPTVSPRDHRVSEQTETTVASQPMDLNSTTTE